MQQEHTRSIRIFISSPDDVDEERGFARRAIEQLRVEFAGRVVIELMFWEDQPFLATRSFQEQIGSAAEADIVITLFWSKLGTPLPQTIRRADGSTYESGTVYEFEQAMAAAERSGDRPAVLVYRRTEPITIILGTADLQQRERQRKTLEAYLDRWFAPDASGALNRAFRPYETPEAFERLIKDHLRRLVHRLVPDSFDPRPDAVAWQGSPFRGLESFEFEHAAIFCGREAATGRIVELLASTIAAGCAFVLIVGMSGSGKSSLLRAGVVPRLAQQQHATGRRLRRAIFRPGISASHLVSGLAKLLREDAAVPELASGDAGDDTFENLVERSPGTAAAVLTRTLRAHDAWLVLLLDQLEEIFSLIEIDTSQRTALLSFLELLAVSGRVWVLASLRSDYYAHALEEPTLAGMKFAGGQFDLQMPGEFEIAQMIRFPARLAGLRFEERDGQRLDDILRDEAAKNPRALPLLEFTLQQLHAEADGTLLRFSDYEKIGGLKGSIAQKAESAYGSLGLDARAALGRVLAALSTADLESTVTATRRQFPLQRFAADAPARELIEAFVKARLFVMGTDADNSVTVEVTHEALLSEWQRARGWSEENRELLRIHTRVKLAAGIWDREGRNSDRLAHEGHPLEDARKVLGRARMQEIRPDSVEIEFVEASVARATALARRRTRLMVGFASLATIAFALAGVAWIARNQAEAERVRAESQRRTAQSSIDFLLDVFEQSKPRNALGRDRTVREVIERSQQKVRSQLADAPDVRLRVLRAIGEVYTATASNKESIELLEEVVKEQAEVGSSREDLAAAHFALAEAYYGAQSDDQAAKHYEVALKLSRESGSEQVMAGSLSGLAEIRRIQQQWDDARSLYERALAIDEKLFGKADSRVLGHRLGLARITLEQRGFSEGRDELLALRSESVAFLGRLDHPDVAQISLELANAHWSNGDSESARKYYEEVASTYSTVYHKDDPEIANVLNSLARIELEVCDLDPAHVKLVRSLGIQEEKISGPQELAVLSLHNLGLIKQRRGELGEARRAFDAALATAQAYRRNVATRLNEDYEEARKNDSAIERPNAEAVEAEIPDGVLNGEASALIALAELDIDEGKRERAERRLKEARRILVDVMEYPPTLWRVGLYNSATALLTATTDRPAARKQLNEALQSFMQRWPNGSLFSAVAIERLQALGGGGEQSIGCPKPQAPGPRSMSVSFGRPSLG
jgi:tetratricopeptide (TPR) repeat protein